MALVYPIGIPLLYHFQLKQVQSKMHLDPGQRNLVGKKAWKRQGVEEGTWEFVLIDTSSGEDELEEINEAKREEILIKIELAKAKARAWTERGLMIALHDPKPPEEKRAWEKVESLTEEEALQCAVYIRSKNEEDYQTMTRISFLYSMYEPQCYDFEVKETVRKLLLTGGLIFLKPGTASQIVVSILMCLGSIRTYAYYNPFVDPKTDIIAEVAQWSLFFIMFGALLIRVNIDSESLQDRGYFDAILVGVNLTPLLLPVIQQLAIVKKFESVQVLSTMVSQVGAYLGFGGDLVAAKKQIETLKKNFQDLREIGLGRESGGRDDEETGRELVGIELGAVTLGGGSMPRTSKFSVANPLRDTPMAASGTPNNAVKNKADTGRPNSSFDAFKNPNLVVGGKGRSKNKNKKNINKEPPKRRSLFAIPKEHLEDAPIGPPKIPPPPTAEDDDIGPPLKPFCQWTEEWDTEFGAIYYLNIDGETSTWDMPDDFWRDGER
ncbi:hypothetical protein TrLO_g7545 [Triparma laevis f. longispina]|uniref:WW domain-containing protein n=1 Tax=Triparma laevis f. longispina TaxID=1714387 RepID=A0A9W7AIN5_9STRA|nr:hypothetical protein TrLO_g7545 [Triparma laevis f. longispina]